MLRSLVSMVRALGSLPSPPSAWLPETIIAAMRAGEPGGSAPEPLPATPRKQLNRRWLRLTVPIAVALGVALSLVNQGGMLVSGEIDVRMCVICALNFLLPFAALNLLLLAVASWAGNRS